jgi:hypothetical protein
VSDRSRWYLQTNTTGSTTASPTRSRACSGRTTATPASVPASRPHPSHLPVRPPHSIYRHPIPTQDIYSILRHESPGPAACARERQTRPSACPSCTQTCSAQVQTTSSVSRLPYPRQAGLRTPVVFRASGSPTVANSATSRRPAARRAPAHRKPLPPLSPAIRDGKRTLVIYMSFVACTDQRRGPRKRVENNRPLGGCAGLNCVIRVQFHSFVTTHSSSWTIVELYHVRG